MRIALLTLMILLMTGGGAAQDRRLNIVATTTQASDLIRIVSEGLDHIHITALMGAGVDPHLYQPTESDIAAMNRADIIIYSGLHLEGQFEEILAALGEQGIITYALGDPVKAAGFIIGGFDLSENLRGVDDPHFWFDPRNWEIAVQDLAEALADFDPEGAAAYQTNAAAYIKELRLLYEWAQAGLRSIDESQRYLVTSHDAFQYFGAAFGWRMQAIQGLSTEDEAGVGDIQATVDFVIDSDIPVLFVESSVPPDTIEAVIAAVQAQGHNVRLGLRELYGDAMDAPEVFGGTYVGMIAQNALTIMQSYRCMGAAVDILDWPEGLSPRPPEDLLNVDCGA